MKKGFTLIELLVVVLIIGILAAVAVPQYQKAVDKARFSQLETVTSSIAQAAEVYYLANGVNFTDLDELSLQMACEKMYGTRWKCGDFYCDLRNNKTVTCVNEKLLKNGYGISIDFASSSAKQRYCIAESNDTKDKYNYFCKTQTKQTTYAFGYSILSGIEGVYTNSYWYAY